MSIPSNGEKRKILVIDDEPHVVTYLTTLLQDNGYETVSASNGREGLETAKRVKPDLVCLDITMPEETGIRFYRNLKDDPDLSKTPVVVVTAVTYYGKDPEPFKRFLSTRKQVPPPEGFIPKPIDREKLLSTISDIFA
jgi:CheY-like chemotaxis protein